MNKKKFYKKVNIYTRFGLDLPSQSIARKKFITFVKNMLENARGFYSAEFEIKSICWDVSNDLMIKYSGDYLNWYYPSDFIEFLSFLESVYKFLPKIPKQLFVEIINEGIEKSVVDLGIRFKAGKFFPSGAKELDEALIEEILLWLGDSKFQTVRVAFHNALEDYSEIKSDADQRKMSAVIKNSYEALEATVKIFCNNDKDLSTNRERFIKKLNINEVYKGILRQYIDFANRFRHPERKNKSRPKLKGFEVETFLYMSGIFIRLTLESIK